MNHIALGSDGEGRLGIILGLAGIALVVLVNLGANWSAWRHPRFVQRVAKIIVGPIMRMMLDRSPPRSTFKRSDISPWFWINGQMPTCDVWIRLADDEFKEYRLIVRGLVANPVALSLAELRALGHTAQITLHHCIQGWSGIAEWGGVQLSSLIAPVRPLSHARAVVFYSFADGVALDRPGPAERYYDSLTMHDALMPQTMLAYEMNSAPLSRLHGAPLRLRVENQLGFKMVKWIEAIEFVENVASIRGGEGGFAEDREYFGEAANI